MSQILTEYSPWFIIICALAGLFYSWLLYKKDSPWSTKTNLMLASFRFLLVFIICLILLGPYVKQVKNFYEKPVVVLAVDNSQSIPLVTDSVKLQETVKQLDALSTKLGENEYDVEIHALNDDQQEGSLDALKFDSRNTDLSKLLKDISVSYESKNLAGVILLSDGIYNQGISPEYAPYSMPVFSVGIGDTMPQVDLNLKTVFANKIAYLGNKFPLVAEVANSGFAGKSANVILKQQGKELDRQKVDFSSDNGIQNVDFLAEGKEEGMQHYVIEVQPLDGEFTLQNNVKNIYIDVLDSKEKILVVAASPHPDIKAIRSIVEGNENYEFEIYIPGLSPEADKNFKPDEKYDLVIFHQVPNFRNIGSNILKEFQDRRVATWFILGNQTDVSYFNQANQALSIITTGRQTDRVTPDYNAGFSKFTFDNEKKAILAKSPPVTVPFGNFELAGNSEVILYQKVGSIVTDKPMLVVNEQEGVKSAVLLGEGIWQWKLQEFASNKNNEAFDDMISKLIQYLSTKEDKRKFRVYPSSNELFDSETVFFETEVYNDIYEKISGQKIDLQITNEDGETKSYNYVNNNTSFRYAVNGLEHGIYKYQASTVLEGKTEVSSGEFTIKKLEIEAVNTTANFNLLRNLAKQSGGQFYNVSEIDQMGDDLVAKDYHDVIHSQEEFQEILNIEWILAIILLLATVEWVIRKVKGAY
ncbi:VWA domain-containing protein [Chondrinema litorale]|uniref:VWA domain-containing protein n=1 Tax=Chondrinema litorale TaxID=2994555 RepID=UPI002543F39E|nr:VWA domain-containing protein [Chondrinema litorale]UZR96037.1 VWA domain-containing protein [Chondrinema litorale]